MDERFDAPQLQDSSKNPLNFVLLILNAFVFTTFAESIKTFP